MSIEKKQRLFDMSIATVKILLYVLLFFNAFVFIYYGLINRGVVVEKETVTILEDWNVVYAKDGDQTISLILPQDIKDNEYLFFETRNDVSVYINDELRKDFVENRDINIPGGSFKRFLMSVPLEKEDSGAEIVIVRQTPQDIDTDVPEIFISTRYGAVSRMLRTGGMAFILSFIVLIFSFAAFIVSIVLSILYRQRIDMLYGALGIFVIACWLITDSQLFPFIFGVYHVNGLLSFLFCLIIPLPLIVFISSIQRGRYKTGLMAVMVISIINAAGWPLLHFTGIIPFYHVRTIANDILVVLAVLGLAVLIADAVKGHVVTYRYTFIGFIGFLVGCLIELAFTLLDFRVIRDSVLMVFGLGFLLIFIVIQQVDDLRKINMEKKHAIDISEAKTRFLASMSHEIRTPINAILGMNEMILRENSDKAIEDYSRNIKTSGKMLLMLVNDVLDFTRIESGKIEITKADFLMSEMLYDVLSLINERAEEKNLELKTEIAGEVPNELCSDEFRIRQILINLLNNAVKYTEKGTVTLVVGGSYTDDDFKLVIKVRDTGKGIRKEDQEHLFEAFSRADVKSNINIEGTGLGLAIVKSIVDSMNGEYGVESEYGIGSEFWVVLPVEFKNTSLLENDFMERRVERPEVSDTCSFIAPEAKILAVDDNQSNLTIVKLFLKRNGIVPELCSTGDGAEKLCTEKKYDLILLDHMMPEPDGIETLHFIRNDEFSLNKDTKVVVLTANAVAGSRQMYISEGFDEYLTKPIESSLLEETVKNLLPKEKVIETETGVVSDTEIQSSLSSRLSSIDGLDYDTALGFCGNDENLLMEVIADIAKEGLERSQRMKKSLEDKDIKAYEIDAHTIKSSMATIGLKEFSERAKGHEFAAKENNLAFIYGDAEEFINEYIAICKKLENI